MLSLALGVDLQAAGAQSTTVAAPVTDSVEEPGLLTQALFSIVDQQRKFHRKLTAALNQIQQDGAVVVWTLIATSFLYGVFHAAGPGHGKAVLTAYLVTHPHRIARGIGKEAFSGRRLYDRRKTPGAILPEDEPCFLVDRIEHHLDEVSVRKHRRHRRGASIPIGQSFIAPRLIGCGFVSILAGLFFGCFVLHGAHAVVRDFRVPEPMRVTRRGAFTNGQTRPSGLPFWSGTFDIPK